MAYIFIFNYPAPESLDCPFSPSLEAMTSAKTQRGESWLLFRSLWLFSKTSEHCSYHHHGEITLNNLEGFQPKGKRKWVGGMEEEVEFGNICFKENENLKPKEREALARLSLSMTLDSFSVFPPVCHAHSRTRTPLTRAHPSLPSGD